MNHVIPILGRDYAVKYVSMADDEYGLCLVDEGEIHINKAKPLNARRDTIVHEVLHAILGESGLNNLLKSINDEMEEAIVVAIERGILRSGLVRKLATDEFVPEDEEESDEP